ncbi:MAG: small multi-drug export protein [Spirochaetales bacterium]|nr:small multi-drug export protein [Spirochaetales bacterium]
MVYVITAFLALLPISELRGAIPYALTNGLSPGFVWIYCVALNATVGPLVYIFLSTFHRLLVKFIWYETLFERFVEKARHKLENKVKKYGYFGIVLFVAVPLPITGAYTGTLGAWILGLDPKKTFLSVLIGVVISGTIVLSITYFGIETFSFFTKEIAL